MMRGLHDTKHFHRILLQQIALLDNLPVCTKGKSLGGNIIRVNVWLVVRTKQVTDFAENAGPSSKTVASEQVDAIDTLSTVVTGEAVTFLDVCTREKQEQIQG